MAWATLIGLVAAILLISSLLDALDAIAPDIAIITTSRTMAAIASFALVIAATIIVAVEGTAVGQQIDDKLRDVPDLAEGICQRANKG